MEGGDREVGWSGGIGDESKLGLGGGSEPEMGRIRGWAGTGEAGRRGSQVGTVRRVGAGRRVGRREWVGTGRYVGTGRRVGGGRRIGRWSGLGP